MTSNEPAISEAQALEVLAYLVTAARTQIDEAAEYAPLRLMTAAGRLARAMEPNASEPVRQLIAAVLTMPTTAVPRADPEAYVARVDAVCEAVADCLLRLEVTEQ